MFFLLERKIDFLVMLERFNAIREYARKNYIPVIRGESAQILFNTVKAHKPERILEIGTAIGYSGLIMLSAHPGARLHTIEIKQAYAGIAEKNFGEYGFGDRAKVFLGDAGELLDGVSGKFGFIFMDGPKTKYPVYYERLVGLLDTGGILFVDNVLLDGKVRGKTPTPKGKETITQGVREFLGLALNDKRLETELIETGDGVTISRKL